jgi:Fic family protein
MKMTNRQSQLLAALLERQDGSTIPSWVTSGEIVRALGLEVDPAGISRDWATLEAQGIVQAEGSTKARHYRLRTDSTEYLEWDLTRPPELRKPVTYNFEILKNYTPNVTTWLHQDALHALQTQIDYRPSDIHVEDYRRVLNALIIDLSFASSVLENVKISWLDTKSLIEFGERPSGLSERELRIVLNHKDAIEFIRDNKGHISVNRRDIFDLHKMVSAGLLGNPEDARRIRRSPVFFDTSRYRPIDNSFILDEQFDLFCTKAAQIEDPHEQAFFAMAMIPYLQPFQDGNKRTSRLTMNLPLINAGLPPLSFTSMSKRNYMFALLALYERGRVDLLAHAYVQAYQGSAEKYSQVMRFLGEGGTLSTLNIASSRPNE